MSQLESDSSNKQDERRRRFEQDLEGILNDKVLDLKKTFVKSKWEKLRKKQSENPAPTMNRRDETQPCGLYNAGNFCYINSLLQVYF